MVSGVGERPAKSSFTSPVSALPESAPLERAVVHLAYNCLKKVHTVSCYAGACPRALAEACVPCGDRTVVLRRHRKFGCRI